MTKPAENREEPGRPSALSPALPANGDTTEALPQATTALRPPARNQEEEDRLYGNLDATTEQADWIKGRRPRSRNHD